jgi:hypothetical protein
MPTAAKSVRSTDQEVEQDFNSLDVKASQDDFRSQPMRGLDAATGKSGFQARGILQDSEGLCRPSLKTGRELNQ